jgi:predicted HicB family RNase H-like nuclease
MSNKSILGESPVKSRYSLMEDDSEQPKKKSASGSRAKPTQPKQPKGKRDYRINLALTRELGEALKAEAESQGRSVNNFVENIIREYLNR